MRADFSSMKDATRLTRQGDPQAATTTILAALAGHPAADADAVIDVEARIVPDTDADLSARLGSGGESDVSQPQRGYVNGPGEFISGRFGNGAAARDDKLFIPPGAARGHCPWS